ncbi:hypothetical protein RSOLAG1IB_11433 [Rhizoctonia solani AG-1 IB]|uniref:Uncharacterized protein n=1 Tax=Thanatephorus cucumeris (strain AG1-IB / isolate 7/3/14) TaxID=1108050 RepID=A0A0B7FBX4_THACB|nr:hypothetical protein RSOLAG1IB_11433 [Rhizoctonia solani AG-1 IB]
MCSASGAWAPCKVVNSKMESMIITHLEVAGARPSTTLPYGVESGVVICVRNRKMLCTVACVNDEAKGTGVINQTLDFYTSALPSFQWLTVAASNPAPCYMRGGLPPPICVYSISLNLLFAFTPVS